MCTKVTHLTHAGAMIHAKALAEKTGQMPKIYKCQQCGGIHVGYTAAAREAMSKKGRRQYWKKKHNRRQELAEKLGRG